MLWLLEVVMAACFLRWVTGSVANGVLSMEHPWGESKDGHILLFGMVWCAFLMDCTHSVSVGMTQTTDGLEGVLQFLTVEHSGWDCKQSMTAFSWLIRHEMETQLSVSKECACAFTPCKYNGRSTYGCHP